MRNFTTFIDPTIGNIESLPDGKVYDKTNFKNYVAVWKQLMYPLPVFPYKNYNLMKATYRTYISEFEKVIKTESGEYKKVNFETAEFGEQVLCSTRNFIERLKKFPSNLSDLDEAIIDLRLFERYLLKFVRTQQEQYAHLRAMKMRLCCNDFLENMGTLIHPDKNHKAVRNLLNGDGAGEQLVWKSIKAAGCFLQEFVKEYNTINSNKPLIKKVFAEQIANNSKILGFDLSNTEIQLKILSPGQISQKTRQRVKAAVKKLLDNYNHI